MSEKPEKKSSDRNPNWMWGVLIAVWTVIVYVLFFMNFIRDFLSNRGGV